MLQSSDDDQDDGEKTVNYEKCDLYVAQDCILNVLIKVVKPSTWLCLENRLQD
jgi:hypothetical protein